MRITAPVLFGQMDVAPAVTRFVQKYQVAPFVEQKKLRIVLKRFELPTRPISIVYPHARLLPARTRAFIDFIRAEIPRSRAQESTL